MAPHKSLQGNLVTSLSLGHQFLIQRATLLRPGSGERTAANILNSISGNLVQHRVPAQLDIPESAS
jgi:hypothetical protein